MSGGTGRRRSGGFAAARRATQTSAIAAAAAPALKIPPRPATHIRDGGLLVAAGATGFGLAPLVGHAELQVVVLLAGVASAAVTVAAGECGRRRRDLEDRTVEALAPLLGVRQLDRRILRCSRWTRGWPGVPRLVRIHYSPTVTDEDPAWRSDVRATLSSRLLAPYEIVGHDRRRCTLRLRLDTSDPSTAPEPPFSQVRAERAITNLIGPTAKVIGAELAGDELHAITVSHEVAEKLAAAGYRNRIERVVSTMMPGRWRAVWDLQGDSVRFELRPTLPASVWLPTPADGPPPDDLLSNYREVKIACAVDEDGREVFWYPARVPQVMLTGGTGSGKTSMGHALLAEITRRGWPVWVLDAKRVEFLGFRDWPNVQIVAGSVPQQVALIHAVWNLMEYRYQLIEEGKAAINDFEPLVVFLDEFADFRSNLLEWYAQIKVKGDPTRPPCLAEVASLARKARTARIHIVLSTQRPDSEFLGGEVRDNFGFRISMGRLSPQGAMMMWENPAVGVSLPRSRTGRATATHEDGHPVEVQCYRFPDMGAAAGTEERALLDALRPAETRHQRLVIVSPELDRDPDSDEPITYRQYANASWDYAGKRPDLDPLLLAEGVSAQTDGRALSSTVASLGLSASSDPVTGRAPADRPQLRLVVPVAADPETDATDPDVSDDYLGYAPPVHCHPRDVTIGDLIEAEEGSGVWVVVDELPDDDVLTPGMVAISWRGDGDEAGSVSISDDELIPVRHPEENE